MADPALILGSGYVGRRLAAALPGVCTRRLAEAGPATLVFDLADDTTWAALPAPGVVVWTFPAGPLAAVERFHAAYLHRARQVIVLGSASCYRVPAPDAWVDEDAPLDSARPRVAGEEFLRARGATVLALALIWGPDRSPAGWLRAGRIANGRKYVNLCHVDDIVATVRALLARPQPGARLIVCDGAPRRWQAWAAAYDLPAPPAAPVGRESKRLRADRLRALLGVSHNFLRP